MKECPFFIHLEEKNINLWKNNPMRIQLFRFETFGSYGITYTKIVLIYCMFIGIFIYIDESLLNVINIHFVK